jgi:hypothetical protein
LSELNFIKLKFHWIQIELKIELNLYSIKEKWDENWWRYWKSTPEYSVEKKEKEKRTLKRHKKGYLSIPLTAYTNSSLELSKGRPMEPKFHLISICIVSTVPIPPTEIPLTPTSSPYSPLQWAMFQFSVALHYSLIYSC